MHWQPEGLLWWRWPCSTELRLGLLSPCAILKIVPAANPKSVKVNISTGAGVDIEWDDGHRTHYGFQWLRDACPCATCTEERTNHHRQPGEPVKAVPTLLPMYKEPIKPKEAKPVGRYAINISWNDGHSSGIYSWDYLRELCLCEECKQKSGDRVIPSANTSGRAK